MLKKFKKEEILINTIKTHPKTTFDVWNCEVYLNNESAYSGSFVSQLNNVPKGFVSLLDLNVDKNFAGHSYNSNLNSGTKTKIFPFVYKDGDLFAGSISVENYNADYNYGDIITSSYDVSSSVSRTYYSASATRTKVNSLKNILNYYSVYSPHFFYSSSLGDKSAQAINVVEIPKIFYGDSIQKGSVSLSFYISGNLIGQCVDLYRNGCLYQVSGSGSGSIAGNVLYNEGVILLTGSWALSSQTYKFDAGSAHTPKWLDFMAGANDGTSTSDVSPSASFNLTFCGNSSIITTQLFCNANKGEFNYSNNPSYFQKSSSSFSLITSSNSFSEGTKVIKNIASSSYYETEESFKKTTYISEVLVYDEDKKLIGVASLARPVKKTEDLDYTFKLKLDF